jgi:hypothetical protein
MNGFGKAGVVVGELPFFPNPKKWPKNPHLSKKLQLRIIYVTIFTAITNNIRQSRQA